MGIFSKKSSFAKASPFAKATGDKSEGKADNKDKKTEVKPDKVGSAKKENKKITKKEPKKQSMKDLYGETETKGAVAKSGKKEKKIRKYANAYRTLIKPLITEKATNLGAENKYLFEVAREANKIEVAKAITEVYGVKPVSVNIINVSGKSVHYGRIRGKRKDWKKAIICLPEGKTINIYEGV